MKKIIITLMLTLAALCVTATEINEYKLEVRDFGELKVTDGINVVYHCSPDSAGWAYFNCTPDVSKRLLFTNNKAKLHIQVDLAEGAITDLPVLHVYSSGLTKVENSSDSTITLLLTTPVQTLKARVIGNGRIVANDIEAGQVDAGINTGKGHIVLSGTAGRVKLSNVGTGPIEAGGLRARTVKVILLGTGNVDCFASEAISVYGAGSGKVYYDGNPEKISNRSLGVKAIDINAPVTE